MRIASIDIGTNTVLLLIADVDEAGIMHAVAQEQRLPRLGKDVDQRKLIGISAFDKIAWILNEFKNMARQYRSERIIAAATSAVRDADNREQFLTYLKASTGIEVEVLSGEDEALWTYNGAMSGFPHLHDQAVVLDIGGGSSEISMFNPKAHNGNRQLLRYSLQLGSVRITERYLKHSPPLPAEIESARQTILEELSQVRNTGFEHHQLIGVAGTVTTLACIDQHLQEFDAQRVEGYRLHREAVAAWLMKLATMDTDRIRSLSDVTEGRADILPAGVLILYEFMNHFAFASILASERGLRYGLVMREWSNSARRG